MTWWMTRSWLRRQEREEEERRELWWDTVAQEYLDEALGETVAGMTDHERQEIIKSLTRPGEPESSIRGELARRVKKYLEEAGERYVERG